MRRSATLAAAEESRDLKLMPWLDSVVRDVRFGLRMLRKEPLVTIAAVMSLGLRAGGLRRGLLARRRADPPAAAGVGS